MNTQTTTIAIVRFTTTINITADADATLRQQRDAIIDVLVARFGSHRLHVEIVDGDDTTDDLTVRPIRHNGDIDWHNGPSATLTRVDRDVTEELQEWYRHF